MSFGRKGLAPGETVPPQPGIGNASGATPARPKPAFADPYASDMSDDELAAKREAFLAAERSAGTIGSGAIPAQRSTDDTIERALQQQRQTRSKDFTASRPRRGKLIFGDPQGRNLIVAYVLWYFACLFSVHRFYCGASESAWYQIATLFGAVIVGIIWVPLGVAMFGFWLLWIFADLFLMPGMMRRFKAEYDYGDASEVFA